MIPFRTILVAADFSEASHEAFHAACSLTRGEKSKVVVVGVLEPKYIPEEPVYHNQLRVQFTRVPRDPAEHEALNERLREEYAPDQPLDLAYWTREGEAAEEILRAARDTRCDLIAMGTHGRTGITRLLTGSVAESVLRQTECPVLALRSGAAEHDAGPVQVILHPTDFSDASETALQVARLLARDHGARLILLHVTSVGMLGAGMMTSANQAVDLDYLKAIREELEGSDLKQTVEVRSELGDAAFEILRVADDVAASLIVMGTHGRTGLGRLLMGSTAESVLRRARCPVLAVKVAVPGSESGERPDPALGRITEIAGLPASH